MGANNPKPEPRVV